LFINTGPFSTNAPNNELQPGPTWSHTTTGAVRGLVLASTK